MTGVGSRRFLCEDVDMPVSLALADAQALCTSLRSIASSIRDSLSKRLAAQVAAAPDALSKRSIDKSGAEIQAEAMQVALLMQGLPADSATQSGVLCALRCHDAAE